MIDSKTPKGEPDSSPFRVLGMALVIEERGKGARLVFRYPTSVVENDADNVFFALPPKVMAKLFRPKKSLCGQPMTISVGGTVFCCRAVIMQQDGLPNQQQSPSATNVSNLVMFSIFVASVPKVGTSVIPISGWFQGNQRHPYQSGGPPSGADTNRPPREQNIDLHSPIASESFKFIQRVHISLARLCRALEREERRCKFVSFQTSQLRRIESTFKASTGKKPSTLNAVTAAAEKHRRGVLAPGAIATDSSSVIAEMERENTGTEDRLGREKEILDLMISVKPEGSHIHGNLIQELIQAYYALSRNMTAGAPLSLLAARNETVYVNGHVAVPIQIPNHLSLPVGIPIVRPYHTLLFPDASADQIVSCFAPTSNRMCLLLELIHPRKTLSDVCAESGIPILSLLDMATNLVINRVACLSHVLSKRSILSCAPGAVGKMVDKAVCFAQNFHHLSIFTAVSLLTTGKNLGDVVEGLVFADDHTLKSCGEPIQSFVQDIRGSRGRKVEVRESEGNVAVVANSVDIENGAEQEEDRESPLDNYIFRLAAWLRAQGITIPKEEYLIAGNFFVGRGQPKPASAIADRRESATSFADDSVTSSSWTSDGLLDIQSTEERMFQEVETVLNGQISSVALMWKYGLDKRDLGRLRRWGLQRGRLRSLMRLPAPSDDWLDPDVADTPSCR